MLDSLITKLFSDVGFVTKSTRSACLSILHNCQPLLEQYYQVLHYHLVSAIATERIMGKLLSVLLGVFTELALKVCYSFQRLRVFMIRVYRYLKMNNNYPPPPTKKVQPILCSNKISMYFLWVLWLLMFSGLLCTTRVLR